MGYGRKGELSIRAVPDLFSPAHTQLQYSLKVCKSVSGHLCTLNLTVGGNVPG